jgi:VWFA-related protein
MKRACAAAVFLGWTCGIHAQQAPHPAHQAITSTSTAILVDAVVRDRNGQLVTDLTVDDFQVAEDGVPQTIDSFTRVSHGGGIGVNVAWRGPDRSVTVTPAAPVPAAAAAAPLEDAATVALVYDHLSSETLALAQKATLAYVPLSGESPVRVAVFAGDVGVRMLQFFTTDRAAVRRAIGQVLPSGMVEEAKVERADTLLARRREIDSQSASAISGGVGNSQAAAQNGSQMGEREMERALIQTELNMMRTYENFDRAHKGYDTASALMSVIESLSLYPGRKTIVFFSEGLPVTPSLTSKLASVIETANRANVTAYAIDAKGLRTSSTLVDTRKEMTNFVDDRAQQAALGSERSEQPLTMAMERVQDTMQLDSRTGLARLAEETGGFLVEQSNDLTSAFRRIDEDNQFHYLLTYAPKNSTFDGRFRAIKVGVRRSGTHVFARNGYRALRTAPSADSGSYEAPALALLDRTPLPNAFPVNAAAFNFPDPDRPGLSPVAVRVSTSSLQFVVDPYRATYSAQTAVVVRIRDAEGHQVQTLSQEYLLTGDAKDVEAAKKGEILFYREPDLVPGVYSVESIVFDAAADRGSVRITTLTVPKLAPSAPGMSSLVIVSHSEELGAADVTSASPLAVGRTLLYPNLGESILNGSSRELPFFFTLYNPGADAKASVQLLRNGQVLADAPLPLAVPSGPRVQHVGRLPIGALPAGTYELRIKVGEQSRSAYFTLR